MQQLDCTVGVLDQMIEKLEDLQSCYVGWKLPADVR